MLYLTLKFMYCKFCNLPSKGIRFQSTYPIKLQNFIFGNCGQHILYFVYSLYSVPRENCIFQFQCVYQSCTNDCLPLVRKIRGNTGIGGGFVLCPSGESASLLKSPPALNLTRLFSRRIREKQFWQAERLSLPFAGLRPLI